MSESKLNYRKILEIVIIAIVCYWGLNNYKIIMATFNNILSVIMPFLIGFIIAFILNVLMIRVEKLLMRIFKGKIFNYCKRIISIILSMLILIGVLALIINLVLPEISSAVKLIVKSLPEVFEDIQLWSKNNGDLSPQIESLLNNIDLNSISSEFSNLVKIGFTGVLGSTVDMLSMVFGGIINLFVGFVFAFYILVSKETLKCQTNKLMDAYLPTKISSKIVKVATLSRTTFTNFIIGQTIEAVILGSLCAIGMQLLGFPYAPMVGALVGITAFVPIIGAFIGGGIGAFMIMTVDPMQALFFVIYLIVLQQLEGDLIYPRVVGSSVGLPSIWVLFAVTVGGGLWGITGVLFSVPVLSVIYTLIRENVNKVKVD